MTTHTSPPWEKSWTHLDQNHLEALACALAPLLKAGDVVFLNGDLGAGKSTFARALIRQALHDPLAEVPSPTYTLVQAYEPKNAAAIWHYDLYRLGGPDEVFELGIDDALEHGVILIEWPERLEGSLTPDLTIDLQPDDADDVRTLTATATPHMGTRLAKWGDA